MARKSKNTKYHSLVQAANHNNSRILALQDYSKCTHEQIIGSIKAVANAVEGHAEALSIVHANLNNQTTMRSLMRPGRRGKGDVGLAPNGEG
ncbi:hypothetical protein M3J09_013873 [Ascochyta lentis]